MGSGAGKKRKEEEQHHKNVATVSGQESLVF